MSKKRSRQQKKNKPVVGQRSATAIQEVIERIAAAGPDYFQEENFVRLMQESDTVRQEPEFANLSFDPRQTLVVTTRYFPRFKRRLLRAARKGGADAAVIYDEYRIAIIDKLATPDFRQDLEQRLARCLARLNRGRDVEKTEIVLFLSAFLDPQTQKTLGRKKRIPLGLYGLVTAIYEASFDRAMAEIPDARATIGETLYEIWCARHHTEDMALIRAAVEQIDAFEELARRIASDPALSQALQRQEEHLLEAFQTHITGSRLSIELGFFTPDEATLALTRMEEHYWSKPWSPSRYLTTAALLSFASCIIKVVDEIVTPDRVTQMRLAVKALGPAYLQADDERLRALVPSIQAAVHHLESKTRPSHNKVVTALYLLHLAATLDETSLGPRGIRFLQLVEKSHFLRRFTKTLEPRV